jgi:hypothetical protein
MFDVRATRRVEATFAGTPPTRRIEGASGVSEVETDGRTVRCLVRGSFQPFLEAVRGHEVISLSSVPSPDPGDLEGIANGR